MTTPNLRIYGDNILECERALNLLAESIDTQHIRVICTGGPLYAPKYVVMDGDHELLNAQLFPGYKRWNYDVQEHLRLLGAPLREATDVVILRLERSGDGQTLARPILALEFCNALPAGNQAWQRCGRAVACSSAGVPYLYFAEIGGAELDAERREIAARVPNPLVPFAYLSVHQYTNSIAMPVFTASPSMSHDNSAHFNECFGYDEAKIIIKSLLFLGEGSREAVSTLEEKARRIVSVLSGRRHRSDNLSSEEWIELANQQSGREKADWLIRRRLSWHKRITIRAATATIRQLVMQAEEVGAAAVGSGDMPICLIGPSARSSFGEAVHSLYGDRVPDSFARWLAKGDVPLILVWINGFKPGGEDARPDRGLVPLARMVFGSRDVDLLTIVYGPATPATWSSFATSPTELARTNGLWEAILGLSDGVLVDSSTAGALTKIAIRTSTALVPPAAALPPLMSTTDVPAFGEHDVDTTLHTLFSNATDVGVFEGMCNPPGGDWSAISFQSSQEGEIFRWSSLPRVSGTMAKRPDHLIVFYDPLSLMLVIESKENGSAVERNVGPRLTRYIQSLFSSPPNITRKISDTKWLRYSGVFDRPAHRILSAVAFKFRSSEEMRRTIEHAHADLALAVEFKHGEDTSVLHIMAPHTLTSTIDKIVELCDRFRGRIEVKIY